MKNCLAFHLICVLLVNHVQCAHISNSDDSLNIENVTDDDEVAKRSALVAESLAIVRARPNRRQGHAGMVPLAQMRGPIVVNDAQFPIVVYLERGLFFNPVVLEPGEAGTLFNKHPKTLPFGIVAVVGDEPPTGMDSFRNFVGVAALPVSFFVAAALSVPTGGLTFMAPLLMHYLHGGDKSAPETEGFKLTEDQLKNGEKAKGIAAKVAKMFVEDSPDSLMTKLPWQWPGSNKIYKVSGGPNLITNTTPPLKITALRTAAEFDMLKKKFDISELKQSLQSKSTKKQMKVAFEIHKCGDPSAVGKWTRSDYKHSRPRFKKIDDDNMRIEWSSRKSKWAMKYKNNFNPLDWFGGTVLYESSENSGEVPLKGWVAVKAGLPLPSVNMVISNELAKSDEVKAPDTAPEDSSTAQKADASIGMEALLGKEDILEEAPVSTSEQTEFMESFEDAPEPEQSQIRSEPIIAEEAAIPTAAEPAMPTKAKPATPTVAKPARSSLDDLRMKMEQMEESVRGLTDRSDDLPLDDAPSTKGEPDPQDLIGDDDDLPPSLNKPSPLDADDKHPPSADTLEDLVDDDE